MKFILHFSVFCANIGFFCETTKFLEEFLLQAYHQYCVSTIITGSYSYQFFIFVPHCSIALHWSSFESLRLPLAKGSSTSNQAFLLRRKDVTALRCSEPLRYRVGGPSKVYAILCGMGPQESALTSFTQLVATPSLLVQNIQQLCRSING